MAVPHNDALEAALIGRLLDKPALIGQVVGTLLEPHHFFTAAHRLLYAEIVEAFFARQFVRDVQLRQAARDQGIELGAYFGLKAIDDFTHGQQGGELLICGGEPGVGKSAVWWRGALNFAERQMQRPEDKRVGALILSLEMSPTPSAARFASMLAGLKGTDLREGRVSSVELERVVTHFRQRRDVPLWVNHAPTLRASQLRALIAEAIRRHNVGLVVLDHFRMWDLDKRLANKNDEDEEKVRFLKEQIASSMNVALVCLAHTRKPDPSSNGRPKMSDLRGSYQVAAHADFVSFIYRPAMYATETEIVERELETAAEMIWAKNRHGNPGSREFHFNPAQMFIAN
jgi:replicative DNA helicase